MADKIRQDIHNSDVPLVCRSCEARHKGICGVLSPEHLQYVAKHSTRHTYARGSTVAAAGDDAQRCGNVLSGVIKLSKLLADGRQQIVGLQFAPDFVGRPFKQQTDVTAEAATPVRVCAFPRRVIDEIIRQSPEMEHRLYEQSLRELGEAREWMMRGRFLGKTVEDLRWGQRVRDPGAMSLIRLASVNRRIDRVFSPVS